MQVSRREEVEDAGRITMAVSESARECCFSKIDDVSEDDPYGRERAFLRHRLAMENG